MDTTTPDIREGLPSASIIERLALCPGSWNLGQGLERIATPDIEEAADIGDIIHLWLMAPGLVDLTEEQQDIADRCIVQRDALVARYIEGQCYPATEVRYWLRDEHGQKLLSGQLDWSGLNEACDTALVNDYKTGRRRATPSASNLQIRTQAVLFDEDQKRRGVTLQRIIGAIVQPLVSGEPEVVEYDRAALDESRTQILKIVEDARHPNAPLRPGAHCQFCPAKLACPAVMGNLDVLADTPKQTIGGATPEHLAQLLARWQAAKVVGKVLEFVAKERLTADPNAIPNWGLSKPGSIREVSDVAGVYESLHEANLITQDVFLKECVSVSIGNLITAVAKHNQLKKTAAEEHVETFCADFIARKPKAPHLEPL